MKKMPNDISQEQPQEQLQPQLKQGGKNKTKKNVRFNI